MKNFTYFGIIVFIVMTFQSCDPTYSISIINNTKTPIIVDAKITNSFNPGLTTSVIADENNRLQFNLQSGQNFECGFAIAELKDDLPFTELIIYTKNDTITARNKSEVVNLFDKNWIGNLKTPYKLIID